MPSTSTLPDTQPHKQKFGIITPWEDIIICTEPPEDVTEQGVYVGTGDTTDPSKKPEKGIVFAIGPISGKDKLPIDVKVGDLIFYERYTANRINDGGNEYNFVRFKYIMGIKKAE